ncbi:MAG: hypothetical protein H0V63_03480 [Burkholderiaceae bacterium]|nr:hypothetical protein [Burkholderiaceae bacterium]
MNTLTKSCTKCGADKPLPDYYADPKCRDGLAHWCKVCALAHARDYRVSNPERVAAKNKRWREANRDHAASTKRAYREANREKVAAADSAWRAANPERQIDYQRRYTYGTDGRDLLASQGGLCAICACDLASLPPNQQHLDHCHETKRVRGWLCHGCNTGIGKLKDDPALLRAALAYLETA